MEAIVFWKDDEKQKVNPALYSDEAEKMAKILSQDHDGNRKKPNKRTQLRKFYDEVIRLNAEAKNENQKWEDIQPFVHMLAAKAAYALGRELVSENFADFIRSSIRQIEYPEHLAVFANFFEAFMGFYRLHGPRS